MLLEQLDIIIPCYNPVNNWEKRFVSSSLAFEKSITDFKINFILVNDGSTKNMDTFVINEIRTKVKNLNYIKLNKNLGKGAALRKGFETSKGKFVMFTDADFPYLTENMFSMVSRLKKGADIVIGLRDENYYRQVPFLRAKLSKFFKAIVKFIFKIPTTETQAGLKAFSEKGKQVALETTINRYLFDLELVKKASKKDLKFAFVPLTLNDGVVLSKMSLSILILEFKNLIKIILQ